MKNLFLPIQKKYNLSENQIEQYISYISFLQEENKKYDLTNIDTLEGILALHLCDTLEITKTSLIKNQKYFVDIGSGCGVPGIVLAIFYPEKSFILIEVKNKKINFLNEVIGKLNLKNCLVYEQDFQTFANQAPYYVDVFLTRASLSVNEITDYLFKKKSHYKKTEFFYWASSTWKEKKQHTAILKDKKAIITEIPYTIENEKETRNLFYVAIQKS